MAAALLLHGSRQWMRVGTLVVTLVVLGLTADLVARYSHMPAQETGFAAETDVSWLELTGSADRHPFQHRHRRPEPLAVRLDLAADGRRGVGELGGDRRAGVALLSAAADPRNRNAGRFRRPRHHPLLHLLRVHADPAVLPDRPMGRAAAAARGREVLPLHAGRQRADVPRPAGRSCFGATTTPMPIRRCEC